MFLLNSQFVCVQECRYVGFVHCCFVDPVRTLRKQDQMEKNRSLVGKDGGLHQHYADPHSKARLANTQVRHTASNIPVISLYMMSRLCSVLLVFWNWTTKLHQFHFFFKPIRYRCLDLITNADISSTKGFVYLFSYLLIPTKDER